MLTALDVKNAKPKDQPYKITDGRGLFLHVSPKGTKTFRYRFSISGKESTYVLGEYPLLTLEKARFKLAEAREMVRAGINPGEERRQKKRMCCNGKKSKR